MTVQDLIGKLMELTPEQKQMEVVYGYDNQATGSPIRYVYEGLDYGIDPVIRLNQEDESWKK